MSRELLTSWSDYQSAIDRLLPLAQRRICIYDEDLVTLNLQMPGRIALLQHLLGNHAADCLAIALRNATPLQQRNPLMLRLLSNFGHNTAVQQTPEQLAHLRDSILLVDDCHGLIRFDRDQPRSKLLIDEPDEVLTYRKRFDSIWAEGGTPVTPTTLGL
jgi:hypothetical protein